MSVKDSPNFLEVWRSQGTRKSLKAGVYLWQEGDASREAILILDGEVEIFKLGSGGEEIVLRMAGPGETLGEMACLDGIPHSASLRTATHCIIASLTAEKLKDLVSGHPGSYEFLYRQQTGRLRSLTRKVSELNFNKIFQRTLLFLLEEADRGKLAISITHQDLARRIGATRESVTKALGTLARSELVSLSRGRISIADINRLKALARECGLI